MGDDEKQQIKFHGLMRSDGYIVPVCQCRMLDRPSTLVTALNLMSITCN